MAGGTNAFVAFVLFLCPIFALEIKHGKAVKRYGRSYYHFSAHVIP